MATLTKDDAFQFLETVLQLDKPKQVFNQTPKLDFLNIIIQAWHKTLPFQNVTQLCLTHRENRLPTVQEIVADMMAGLGGVCLYHAVFCQILLSALEFKAHFVAGKVGDPLDHAIVVVEDIVENGDRYLVEVGCGFPAGNAIPLDFSTKTEHTYSFYGLEYKYEKQEKLIVRFHARREDERRLVESETGKWHRFYDFDMEYRDLEFLFSDKADIKRTLLDRQNPSWFMIEVRAVIFTEDGTIAIKDRKLLLRTADSNKEIELDKEEKLLQAFDQYFTMLAKSLVLEGYKFADINAETARKVNVQQIL